MQGGAAMGWAGQVVEWLREYYENICYKYPPSSLQSGESDMGIEDIPTETPDSLFDASNAGELDEPTFKRKMRQLNSSVVSQSGLSGSSLSSPL